MHSAKFSTGFSKKIVPSNPAVVKVNENSKRREAHWILGGRRRMSLEQELALNKYPFYFDNFLKEVWILHSHPLQDNLIAGPDMPVPLAFHCAVALPLSGGIFIHGGMTDPKQMSSLSFILSYKTSNWSRVSDIKYDIDNICCNEKWQQNFFSIVPVEGIRHIRTHYAVFTSALLLYHRPKDARLSLTLLRNLLRTKLKVIKGEDFMGLKLSVLRMGSCCN